MQRVLALSVMMTFLGGRASADNKPQEKVVNTETAPRIVKLTCVGEFAGVKKAAKISNTSKQEIPDGVTLDWTSNDGEKGSLRLTKPLPVGAFIYSTGGTNNGKPYTCDAFFEIKLSTPSHLDLSGIGTNWVPLRCDVDSKTRKPRISNTTKSPLPVGSQLQWTSTSGEQGTHKTTEVMTVGGNDLAPGSVKASTCEAKFDGGKPDLWIVKHSWVDNNTLSVTLKNGNVWVAAAPTVVRVIGSYCNSVQKCTVRGECLTNGVCPAGMNCNCVDNVCQRSSQVDSAPVKVQAASMAQINIPVTKDPDRWLHLVADISKVVAESNENNNHSYSDAVTCGCRRKDNDQTQCSKPGYTTPTENLTGK
jgi:hypothetical protein